MKRFNSDLLTNTFNGIITTRITVFDPCFVRKGCVVVIVCEECVESTTERCGIVVKLLSDEIVLGDSRCILRGGVSESLRIFAKL